MDLLGTWIRKLAAASGAALAVPFAVGSALIVLALGGAFGSLGSLGEIFSGPRESVAPAAARQSAPAAARLFAASAALVATASARPVRPVVATARVAPSPARSAIPTGSAPPAAVALPVGGSAPARAPVPTPAAVVGRVPVTAPPAPPSVTAPVVGVAKSVIAQLPGPVGKVAAGAVQTAGTARPPVPAPATLPNVSHP